MQLEDWLDDLCVRFIINLPPEELASVERICFQVEEAQWFYEDFIRPLDPTLPSLPLKQFSLRIFQHCPLFSQWSAQHHTTAFAEFLAYKQRVPVRGAIMLNENMDEVVLVKGWKKGANWSFPRGKINKDEDDLDCAVREVYEETGFDIKAAGLVKAEKDMKYIEVTMREQHMRLYVFRGVPKDTYFEPRTRKEISKIEWYKLNDLPTQKKKHQHDPDGESLAINANKFYMVAPFLHPLKKWIGQQKKRENRYSSNLAAPPVLAEDSATDFEVGLPKLATHLDTLSPNVPSSLPEVTRVQPLQQFDPSAHLKELLQIGTPTPFIQHSNQPAKIVNPESQKSHALLALLRNGSTSEAPSIEQKPLERPHLTHLQPEASHPQNNMQTSHAGFQPSSSKSQAPGEIGQQRDKQNLLNLFKNSSVPLRVGSEPSMVPTIPSQQEAPYDDKGVLQAIEQTPVKADISTMPDAPPLPKLTNHTQALLDAFKVYKNTQSPIPSATTRNASQPEEHNPRRRPLDAFFTSAPMAKQASTATGQPMHNHSDLPVPVDQKIAQPIAPSFSMPDRESTLQQAQEGHTLNLLDLFKRPAPSSIAETQSLSSQQQTAPAELAASSMEEKKPQVAQSQTEILTALFKKDRTEQHKRQRSPIAKAGQTGATIDTPLNQPDFASFVSSPPIPQQSIHRSPPPANRTLYDPNHPAPVKILSRPDGRNPHAVQSSKSHKTNMGPSSPRRVAQPKSKPFQPQILRRPQTAESRDSVSPSPSLQAAPSQSQPTQQLAITSLSPSVDHVPVMSPTELTENSHPLQKPDTHRQTLLSLFGGGSSIPSVANPQPSYAPMKRISTSSGIVSPTTQSQIVSPITDEPISTRSRVGSLASVASGGVGQLHGGADGRPKVEKRQTAAGDKAFLLGYLGRIASQEG